LIDLYALMSDRELEKRISEREYHKNVLKGYLSCDLPFSVRDDFSLELALVKKDLSRLYDEKNLRGRPSTSSMMSQSHLEAFQEA